MTKLRIPGNYLGNPKPLAAVTGFCRELHLQDAGISDSGIPQLIGAILANPTVEVLDLSSNPQLTDDSARQVLTLVHRQFERLKYVRMEGCSVPRGTIRKIRDRCVDNYYRTVMGRSSRMLVARAHAATADEKGQAELGAVLGTINEVLTTGPLPSAAVIPRPQSMPWQAVARQRLKLDRRLRKMGELTGMDRRLSLSSILEMVFDWDLEVTLGGKTSRERVYMEERNKLKGQWFGEGGEQPPEAQHDPQLSLARFIELSAQVRDPEEAEARMYGAEADRRRAYREQTIGRYLQGVAAEFDAPLRRCMLEDGSVLVQDFAEAAGLRVTDVVERLKPFQLTGRDRISLQHLGRVYA